MRIRAIIYSLLLTTLCVGCGERRYMPQLERLEAQLDTAPHLVQQSIDLFQRESWHRRLQQLSELRSKDVPPFTLKEREQLAEALERCFITVITNLRDEAAKQDGRLSAEDIHLCLLLSLGYSIGVIRECQAAASDDVIRKRRVRLSGKLPEDILQAIHKPTINT